MTKYRILLIFIVGFIQYSLFSQPVNNPYKELYPDAQNHWTDELPWSNVHDINDFSGADWDEKLENAQQEISGTGGGVIYFPSGTYNFYKDITVKKNIIIRGATPDCKRAVNDSFAPPTRWIFPQYIPAFTDSGTSVNTAFKRIRSEFSYLGTLNERPNVRNHSTGLVYLDINRANLIFHPSVYNQAQPGGGTDYSPCYMDRVIIFGVRNNNAAQALPFVPTSSGWQHQWQRWPWQYVANIDAWVDEKLVISNNRFNDYLNNIVRPISDDSFEQPGYIIATDDTLQGFEARFEYNDHYGIVANRFLNFYTFNDGEIDGDLIIFSGYTVTPQKEPYLFGREVEINDNWLYQTKRVAMFVAGMGMQINNNVIRDEVNKIRYISSNGLAVIDPNAFFENRGIDFTGWDIVIEGNDIYESNTRTGYSGYSSNDGEGILIQECCGGSSNRNYTIRRNKLSGPNAYIGLYKVKDIHNVLIDSNNLGTKNIYVNANTNSLDYKMFDVLIQNNFNVGNIVATGDVGGSNCFVKNNSGTGSITASCYVTVENNTGMTYSGCTAGTVINLSDLHFVTPAVDSLITTDTTILITGFFDTLQGHQNIVLWDNLTPVDTIYSKNPLEFSYRFRDNGWHYFRLSTYNFALMSTTLFVQYTGEELPVATSGELEIAYTSVAPQIDGDVDLLWSNALYYKAENVLLGNNEDISCAFATLWDENNFYLLAEVKDDILSDSGQYAWDHDQVEVYIDIGNDKAMTYGADDYQFQYQWNGTFSETKHGDVSGITKAQKAVPGGYVVEFSFPWSVLGETNPVDGRRMGIDVHCIDNDDSTSRVGKIAWNATSDDSWKLPALFGTAGLSALPLTTASFAEKLAALYYPNPFRDVVTVVLPENCQQATVKVLTIQGRLMDVFTVSGNHFEVGQHYPPGIYVISVFYDKGEVSFIVIKKE